MYNAVAYNMHDQQGAKLYAVGDQLAIAMQNAIALCSVCCHQMVQLLLILAQERLLHCQNCFS